MFKFLTAVTAFVAAASPALARPADDRLSIRIPMSTQDLASARSRAQFADRVDRRIRTACRNEWVGFAGLVAVQGDMACRKALRSDAEAKLLALNVKRPAAQVASAR